MPSKFKPTRQRKHKILARENKISLDQNPNEAIISETKSQREERREKLQEELRPQQQKISSKKQKRLNKYIENKLKKEENLELLKKLAREKDKYDTRGLQSSRNLRKRGFDEFVADQNSLNAGYEVLLNHASLKNNDGEEYSDLSEDSFEANHPIAFAADEEPVSDATWLQNKSLTLPGTGLAQPLQIGSDGLPIIPQRTNRKKTVPAKENILKITDAVTEVEIPTDSDEELWEGFSSDGKSDQSDEEVSKSDNSQSRQRDFTLSSTDSSDGIETEASDDESSNAHDEDDPVFEDFATTGISSNIKPRESAFKAWAHQQLNHSIGHVPSYEQQQQVDVGSAYKNTSVRPAAAYNSSVQDIPVKIPNRIAYSVHVERSGAMQAARQELPILQREQEIMEAIHNNAVIIIKGDTGSGKTTQVPQFLYEAGYGDPNGATPGLIGITQPRRVAAVSMANRVSEELASHGDRVAHQIRFDTTVSTRTAIKFMTDGVLLRELSQDLLLKKYSVIVIDEAHERSVNTDLLIGILSKIVPARSRKSEFNPDPKPLKLIIMSATLKIEDFLNERLFAPDSRPPIVEAEGRQHRVTMHFALRSRADYVEETIEKVKRAHRKLPKGGILVFLTGQSEIRHALNRLRQELRQSNFQTSNSTPRMQLASKDVSLEIDDIDIGPQIGSQLYGDEEDEIDILADEDAEDRDFEISDEEDGSRVFNPSAANNFQRTARDPYDSVHLLPLYSQLPTKEQLRVFEAPPERSRLIVLATNVAETSLTIPGIRFVFDCGRSKERKYNLDNGVQTFDIDYISKASAQQRAGRAGRTGPGHCWRLYSSAVYEQFFADYADPEILRTPAENIVLQLKGFRYPKPVSEFPFPTLPPYQMLDKAEKLLRNLGAIDPIDGAITNLGKQLSTFPLSPRLGKILMQAILNPNILRECIYLVSALAVGEMFVNEAQLGFSSEKRTESEMNTPQQQRTENESNDHRQQFGRAHAKLSSTDQSSDAIKMLTAVSMHHEALNQEDICQKYFLRPKAMAEITQLIGQLGSIVRANHPGVFPGTSKQSSKPSSHLRLINSIAASGYIDQVAIRWDLAPNPPSLQTKPKRATDVPYLPLMPISRGSSGDMIEKVVFIHPSSVLSRFSANELPQYIIFTHLQQAQVHTIGAEKPPKTRMFPLVPINASTLLQLVRETALIEYGKPVQKTKIEELRGSPKRRICWVTTEVRGGGAGTFAWPLPPSRVRQVMDLKAPTGWRVEEVLG